MAARKAKKPGTGSKRNGAAAKKASTKKAAAKKPATKKPAAKKPATKKASARKQTPKAVKKAAVEKARVGKPSRSSKATPARDALKALVQKKAIKRALLPVADGKEVVDAYMRDLDHPFKAEIEAVRRIILGASDKLAERIKWNAPSFYYKEDFGAFNLRANEFAHLILLFPGGAGMDDRTGLLEGKHKDRREAKFHGMDDVKSKQGSLQKLVKRWVALRERG